MTEPHNIVFLFDVDNTLLDNDRVRTDLSEHLEQTYGTSARNRYSNLWILMSTHGRSSRRSDQVKNTHGLDQP